MAQAPCARGQHWKIVCPAMGKRPIAVRLISMEINTETTCSTSNDVAQAAKLLHNTAHFYWITTGLQAEDDALYAHGVSLFHLRMLSCLEQSQACEAARSDTRSLATQVPNLPTGVWKQIIQLVRCRSRNM